MSRSGYIDDCNNWDLIRWRGAVASAIRGKRGQAFLRELLAALDAMPEKRLTTDALIERDGDVCALGSVGRARGIDMAAIDPNDYQSVAKAFGITETLAREIMFENDDDFSYAQTTPEDTWKHMRAWVVQHIDGGTP